ncbi:MAG: hypothetical protein ACFB20_04360 [Opitutales bacterium]
MSQVEAIKTAIVSLPEAEKAQLLHWVQREVIAAEPLEEADAILPEAPVSRVSKTRTHRQAIADIERQQRDSLCERVSEFDSSGSITRDPF